MIRKEICRKTIELEDDTRVTFIYCLVGENVTYEFDSDTKYARFGVEITNENGTDSAGIVDVTENEKEAEELARLLAKHTVTPVTLHDVIYDYLCSR